MKKILKPHSLALNAPSFKAAVKSLSVSVLGGLILSACSDVSTGGEGRTAFEVEGDHAVGAVDAPITVVEYASVTCAHCANWHEAVWPTIQSDYVDTGKVRFIYREFPTAPQNLAFAGFLIANCADDSQFFANIGLQYERQVSLMEGARAGRAKQDYEALAKAAGLNEEQYMACLQNEDERARLDAVITGGIDAGVTGTPSFFVNGEKKTIFTIEEFDEVFAEFVEVPERKTADANTDSGHSE